MGAVQPAELPLPPLRRLAFWWRLVVLHEGCVDHGAGSSEGPVLTSAPSLAETLQVQQRRRGRWAG